MKRLTISGLVLACFIAWFLTIVGLGRTHVWRIRRLEARITKAEKLSAETIKTRDISKRELGYCRNLLGDQQAEVRRAAELLNEISAQQHALIGAFRPLTADLRRRCRNTDDNLSCKALTALDTAAKSDDRRLIEALPFCPSEPPKDVPQRHRPVTEPVLKMREI